MSFWEQDLFHEQFFCHLIYFKNVLKGEDFNVWKIICQFISSVIY